MAMNPNFTPGFRSGPKLQGNGLLGGFRNSQNPVDFNAQAMELAGDPGTSGERGLLGQQLSGGGGPDAMIDPGSLPGADVDRFNEIRTALGMGPFPNQVPFRDTIDFMRMWEQGPLGNKFTPMGGNSPFFSQGGSLI